MNKSVITVLEELNKVTNSVILKYPVTFATSTESDVRVMVDLSQFDDNSFPNIGLLDSLGSYLSIYKLFGDKRTVEYNNDSIYISEGEISTTFITSSLVLMDGFDLDSDQFDKVESAPSVCEFTLTTDDISKLNKAAGVYKDLNDIIITSIDSDVAISLGSIGKFNAKDNSFKIDKNVKSTKDFSIRISTDNFNKLPSSEFIVKVKYNQSKDSYRLLLINTKIDNYKILINTKI